MANKRLLVMGSSNTDMCVATSSLPVPGQTVLGGMFKMGPGGKGANQAVAAARLGGEVALVCKLGNDLFGDRALAGYKDEGLDVSGILKSDKPSGVALITVDSRAENCIVVAPGANMDFLETDVESSKKLICDSGMLLLQLEIPVKAVFAAVRAASAAGVPVVLNPAPFVPLPDEIYKYIDLFIPNETELSAYSGIVVSDVESAKKACARMAGKGIKTTICTLGSKGSLIYDGNSFVHVPACKVDAVDTTAAGDTYCGAICVGLLEGMPVGKAAEFASRAASVSVTRRGAQSSMPYRSEIK